MLEQLPDAVGHALRNLRAGLDHTAFNQIDLRTGMGSIDVRSLAFIDHAPLPARYTADGEGLSPPLSWGGVPDNAGSLLLLVEDADAPTPHPLVHAIVVGLPPEDGALAEGAIASPGHEGVGLATGRNSFLGSAWLPPDPPPGHGPHRYVFQVFALSGVNEFSATPGREEVLKVLQASAIASGCLIGTCERADGSIREPASTSTAFDGAIGGGLAPA